MWRVISAVLGIPLLLISVWLGGIWFFLVVCIIMTVSTMELHGISAKLKAQPSKVMMIGGTLLICGSVFISGDLSHVAQLMTALIFLLLVIAILKKEGDARNLTFTVFSWMYPGLLFCHILLLRSIPGIEGLYFTVLLFVITWVSDSAAYFVGINYGRHKLCPSLSPKKSVEGCLGSIVITVMVLVLINFIMTYFNITLVFAYEHVVLLGLIGACLAQVGDLVESMLKRSAKIKDSGNIIPGHGGMLDRFDSILFVAPGIYYYISFIIL